MTTKRTPNKRPPFSLMEYIALGYILKPFGLKGEVRCKSLTSFAKQRFKKGTKLSLHDEKTNERFPATVKSFRDSGDYYFLSFEEYGDINAIEGYKGFAIEMDKEAAVLPEGYYRYADLIGCKVVDYLDENRVIGVVDEVLEYSKVRTLSVTTAEKKHVYVPFKDGLFIKNVDIDNKVITINVMEGLL